MGGLLARFRKEKTTFDILEKLEETIKHIEEHGQNTERRRKQIVANLLIVSVGLYFVSVILFYMYSPPKPWSDRLLYVTPFIVFPVLVFSMKKAVAWHYNRKISRNSNKLKDLQTEKKKILEEVMDKETYKVARTILERFADRPLIPSSVLNTPGHIRQRDVSGASPKTADIRQSNALAIQSQQPNKSLSAGETIVSCANVMTPMKTSGLPQPLLRPVVTGEKGFFEKMVDYIVGDGPNNRFALICKQCHNHNGMALREEFEYLSFRCVFCACFNAARKQRPSGPVLSRSSKLAIAPRMSISSSSSDDEKVAEEKDVFSSGSESEEEVIVDLPNQSSQDITEEDKKEK